MDWKIVLFSGRKSLWYILHEEFLETELFEKNILHSSSLWRTWIYNEIWSFTSAKAFLLHRVPQSSKQLKQLDASKQLDVVMALQKEVLSSMHPTNWVKSQAGAGELLVCAWWTWGKTQHLRKITPERICRTFKWTCWMWCNDTQVVCLALASSSLFSLSLGIMRVPYCGGAQVTQFLPQGSQVICVI